jgi:Amt family ammonium transporter
VSPAIGSFVALVCYGVLFLKERYLRNFFPGFDDTLDVATGHGVAGALGTLVLGLVANAGSNPNGGNGLFYGGGFLLLGMLLPIDIFFSILFLLYCSLLAYFNCIVLT